MGCTVMQHKNRVPCTLDSVGTSEEGMEIGTVTLELKATFSGIPRIFGRSTNMNGGSSVCTLNSLGNFTSGPVTLLKLFGLLPAMRKLP